MGAKRVLIAAGGTGGHVFPALAVAKHLRGKGVEVSWLGTRRGLEARVVPESGIPIHWINVGGLRGKGRWAWALAPLRLLVALAQTLLVLLRARPSVVLGMGGFVAGPAGLGAWLLRKPLVIHEQNALPGLTNRWLARLGTQVLEAFPGAFPEQVGAVVTGNPVRSQIVSLPPPAERLAGRAGSIRLLVLGGSQGAQVFNEVVPAALAMMEAAERPEVWHQAGVQHIAQARKRYQQAGLGARLAPFIEDMAEAYAWADLVICRGGALTVSELAAAGVASILVPYPHSVDDHQTRNAQFLAQVQAAIVMPQGQFTASRLRALLQDLVRSRSRLQDMAARARRLAQPQATARVAGVCEDAMQFSRPLLRRQTAKG
jgi:UDP-N-acetylglucosamine--N-acetylmuramyl-(pentapeptide) pyrophosphoryl-undecaprenol N-acetylglucosamine transferase